MSFCKMCAIKGIQAEGKAVNLTIEVGIEKPLLIIDEVLCASHYNILERYIKKFNWKIKEEQDDKT